MPVPCSLVIFSFKNRTAIMIVTMDKAEDIGETRITSPMVKPQLTHAIAAASKTPPKKINVFVLAFVPLILSSRFANKENNNKNSTMPIFTKRVVENHPIFSEITSLRFQKTPKSRAAKTVSFIPAKSFVFWYP